MSHKIFGELNLNDEFFDSLKNDYPGFEKWFEKKRYQDAFVQYNQFGQIEGFLYLKVEEGIVGDVIPQIRADRILKVGTFKINAHKTKLGERFIKIILDYALEERVDVCYMTVFERHVGLINLVEKFGFRRYGVKDKEIVLLKDMRKIQGDINKDYPLVDFMNARKYLLSIYPKYHSVMFPDSILTTENKKIITDISYTNSIHKIYICSMAGVEELKRGDIIVIYRTASEGRSAEYSAVATSVCVVDEIHLQQEFSGFEQFYDYACQYSVFNKSDLNYWYRRGSCKAIKMTYNLALKRRIVRHDLIEKIGLERNQYWGFFELSDQEFDRILSYGGVIDKIIRKTEQTF